MSAKDLTNTLTMPMHLPGVRDMLGLLLTILSLRFVVLTGSMACHAVWLAGVVTAGASCGLFGAAVVAAGCRAGALCARSGGIAPPPG